MQQELQGTVSILFDPVISFLVLFISHAVPQTLFPNVSVILCAKLRTSKGMGFLLLAIRPSLQLQSCPSAGAGPGAAALPLPSRHFRIVQS